MEIRDLEYLAASATAGNFARAAAAIGISTSTISRRVARLEDELGLALFERRLFRGPPDARWAGRDAACATRAWRT
jgi:DNA-binding transcriptional LysR family regulator